MTKIKIPLFIGLFVLLFASAADSKDMTHRISVGYNNQVNFGWVGDNSGIANTFAGSQAISTKYWLNEDLGFEGLFGYLTLKNEDIGGWAAKIAAKVLYNLNKEDNMNFYGGAGLGLLPSRIDYGPEVERSTGFLAMVFLGTEFFLQGLPNLGFDVEFGLQYLTVDSFSQFGTYGGGFGILGIRYYF